MKSTTDSQARRINLIAIGMKKACPRDELNAIRGDDMSDGNLDSTSILAHTTAYCTLEALLCSVRKARLDVMWDRVMEGSGVGSPTPTSRHMGK